MTMQLQMSCHNSCFVSNYDTTFVAALDYGTTFVTALLTKLRFLEIMSHHVPWISGSVISVISLISLILSGHIKFGYRLWISNLSYLSRLTDLSDPFGCIRNWIMDLDQWVSYLSHLTDPG